MHEKIDGKRFAVAQSGKRLTKASLLAANGRLAILRDHTDAFDFMDIRPLIPYLRRLFVSHVRCSNWEDLSRASRLKEVSAYVTAGVSLNLTAHPELEELSVPASARVQGRSDSLRSALVNGAKGANIVDALRESGSLQELKCVQFFPAGSFSNSLERLDISMTRLEGQVIDAPGLRKLDLTNVRGASSLDFLANSRLRRLTVEDCGEFDVASAKDLYSIDEVLAIGKYSGSRACGLKESRLEKGAMRSVFQ